MKYGVEAQMQNLSISNNRSWGFLLHAIMSHPPQWGSHSPPTCMPKVTLHNEVSELSRHSFLYAFFKWQRALLPFRRHVPQQR